MKGQPGRMLHSHEEFDLPAGSLVYVEDDDSFPGWKLIHIPNRGSLKMTAFNAEGWVKLLSPLEVLAEQA